MPDAIFRGEVSIVALVHMDIMDAIAGCKTKDLVGLPRFVPARTKGADHGVRIGDGLLNLWIKQVFELILCFYGKKLGNLS